MAAALSALPFAFGWDLEFKRSSRRLSQSIKAVVPPLSPRPSRNAGFRSLMNTEKLRKMHTGPGPVFASETNPSTNENKPRPVGSDTPPLATILAGVVVFLLFAWLLGSIVLWIVGLIVNVPK